MQDVKMIIAVRTDLNMRKGKMVAQGGHAALKFLIENNESDRPDELLVKLSPAEAQWMFNGMFTKICVGVGSEEELQQLILQAQLKGIEVQSITDVGRTEFNGVATLTCAAFGPDENQILDEVTGHLKPL